MKSNVCKAETCKSECRPERLKYFAQVCIKESFDVPRPHPGIEHIVSAVADCEVTLLRVVDTMEGLSCEGQCLTGKKLAVEIRLRQKILYAAEKESQSIHVLENESLQSCYVAIPCRFEGTAPELLIKNNILRCKVEVEDLLARSIGNRKIYKSLNLLVLADFTPAYELGYSINTSDNSNVFIMFNDGSKIEKLDKLNGSKDSKLLWSPSGCEIAYASECGHKAAFKIYSLKTGIERVLPVTPCVGSIGSCSWAADAESLVFTGYDSSGNREIYSICTDTAETTQLTRGSGEFQSFSPKGSPCGRRIAFIKSSYGTANLWLMNNKGLDYSKLTSCGGVKCFDWSPDGKSLIYVCHRCNEPDRIYITDIECGNDREISLDPSINRKKRIRFSPDGRRIAFIGFHKDFCNIYMYLFCDESMKDITESSRQMEITDFVWSADSDKIYFSASDIFGFGIYSIDPENKERRQLLSTPATKIELSYRGRVC